MGRTERRVIQLGRRERIQPMRGTIQLVARPQGWWSPNFAFADHYFDANARSICGGFLILELFLDRAAREAVDRFDQAPGNCARCRAIVEQLRGIRATPAEPAAREADTKPLGSRLRRFLGR